MIKLHNIAFKYSNQKNLLFDDLILDLPQGNIYGLLGKNAAGKTTLLKLMAGLVFPQKGKSEIMGFNPAERNPEFLANLYFLPEEFYLPTISIDAYLRLYAPFYPKFDSGQFLQHLQVFDIKHDANLNSLSHGQRKKFLVAFGLAANTRLLIMDEPTNGLDIPSKAQFRKALAASLDEECVCIISTHQVRDLENLIDPVIILEEGKILFHQSVYDISKALSFQIEQSLPAGNQILYSEQTLGGHLVVRENHTGEESNIDLEVLFNTVISQPYKIKAIFNKGE